MRDNYILDGRTPRPVDLLTWARWVGTANRTVAKDDVNGVTVSTIFLGIDHGWGADDRPLLFETMVFGGQHDQEMERYATWEEAEAGHGQWLGRVRKSEEWPDTLQEARP